MLGDGWVWRSCNACCFFDKVELEPKSAAQLTVKIFPAVDMLRAGAVSKIRCTLSVAEYTLAIDESLSHASHCKYTFTTQNGETGTSESNISRPVYDTNVKVTRSHAVLRTIPKSTQTQFQELDFFCQWCFTIHLHDTLGLQQSLKIIRLKANIGR